MDRDSKLKAKHGGTVYTFILNSPPNFTLFDIFRPVVYKASIHFPTQVGGGIYINELDFTYKLGKKKTGGEQIKSNCIRP